MGFKLAGIGELLWDLLPAGPQLGGAPANFAYQAFALGGESAVISRIGDDPLGLEAITRLKLLGLSTDLLQIDAAAATGTASVELSADGQPHFVIHENVAWDRLQEEPASRAAVAQADAVCFGTLAQRSPASARAVRELVAATSETALRVFDINLRQHYYSQQVIESSLELASVLKVNENELPVLAEMFDLQGTTRDQISAITARFGLRAVAYTRGERGSLLHAGGEWSEHPGIPAVVADTIGAGDAFTAAMTLGLLAGWELDFVNEQANEVASFVASREGATPALPNRLRSPFLNLV
jgi:fructokinase